MPKTKPQAKKPQSAKVVKPAQKELEFQRISLDLIDDPQAPVRSEITDASLEELVVSIKLVGIIEPLVVKPRKGRYEVIAGHRRFSAAKLAKIGVAPCYIKHASMEQTEMMKIHENLYRSDIMPADEAKHFSYLVNEQNMSPGQIANIIGKSLSYVHDRLAILNYPDFLLEAMNNEEISFSVAREFSKFEDEKQMQDAVYYAKRGGMTQEMARKWVQDWKREKEAKNAVPGENDEDYGNAQQMEHLAKCVYCRKDVRLIDAEVVYMHRECLKEANSVKIEDSSPTSK